MKRFFNTMLVTLSLTLALVLGLVALAETAGPEAPELPPIEEVQPEPAQPEQDAQQPAADATSDDAALRQALDAYRDAKESDRQEALEAELKDFVASGKLTQEQADLILNHYKEQESLRNGTCPGCGYQLRNGGKGMNGRGMGNSKGGRGMNGGRGMFGGQSFGQQPFARQSAPGQADGASFAPDMAAGNGV